ncbi:SDR family oxidoreductase [Roseococcus pinisoli]|uniref:SDR family oxidoreductase n=1 Tax=Roseococcus pinisoli TaxID=2835040 RepID=A0ABS5QCR1_9PROT|nr:SDR family oxidoreductase [Roseococcus pinisoli]
MSEAPWPVVAVLGAGGLIGQEVAARLLEAGLLVVPVARRLSAAQQAAWSDKAVVTPIVDLDTAALADLLRERRVGIVVNALGLLQDSGAERADEVHRAFVGRLLEAVAAQADPPLLVHLSIPGREAEDGTEFSRTKRAADRLIQAASIPYAILRPGFVVAPAAYGGSALIRALAALPLDLPRRESGRPFAATDVGDIARTVRVLAERRREGERHRAAVWDVMERKPGTVGSVVAAFRRRFGGPRPRLRLPGWLMTLGAGAGDWASCLGWRPPIRSTALREMSRGVEGDPGSWIEATGIEPASLDQALARLPATVQERWFGRLYLAKALILGTLAAFWCVSGLVALLWAFRPAMAILTEHGFPETLAFWTTLVTALADIAVGVAIAVRRTSRLGLLAGLVVSLGYWIGATFVAPGLWLDPLGPLVKTGPAMVLMLVALALSDDR